MKMALAAFFPKTSPPVLGSDERGRMHLLRRRPGAPIFFFSSCRTCILPRVGRPTLVSPFGALRATNSGERKERRRSRFFLRRSTAGGGGISVVGKTRDSSLFLSDGTDASSSRNGFFPQGKLRKPEIARPRPRLSPRSRSPETGTSHRKLRKIGGTLFFSSL